MSRIPCQFCKKEYGPGWQWLICDKCGYRICSFCLTKHKGPRGTGGFRCSQCSFGNLKSKSI